MVVETRKLELDPPVLSFPVKGPRMKVFGNQEWAHGSSDFYSDERMGNGEEKHFLFPTDILYMALCIYEPKYNDSQ